MIRSRKCCGRKSVTKTRFSADKVPGFIYRTTATSYIKLAPGFLPASLNQLLSWNDWLSALVALAV